MLIDPLTMIAKHTLSLGLILESLTTMKALSLSNYKCSCRSSSQPERFKDMEKSKTGGEN